MKLEANRETMSGEVVRDGETSFTQSFLWEYKEEGKDT